MSANATRFQPAKGAMISRQQMADALIEIREFESPERDLAWLQDLILRYTAMTWEEWADAQDAFEWKRLGRGVRWMVRRARRRNRTDAQELLSDLAAWRSIRDWMLRQDEDWLIAMSLASESWRYSPEGEYKRFYEVEPGKLLYLGIRFPWQAERFCELWDQVCNKSRPFGSCYQPNALMAFKLSMRPELRKLPVWVKKQLIEEGFDPQTERLGNIWRLCDCARGWKVASGVRKRYAERLGKMPLKVRQVAGAAMYFGHRSSEEFWGVVAQLLRLHKGGISAADLYSLAYEASYRGREILDQNPEYLLALVRLDRDEEVRGDFYDWIAWNYEVSGMGYWLSRDPNDFLFYTEEDLKTRYLETLRM